MTLITAIIIALELILSSSFQPANCLSLQEKIGQLFIATISLDATLEKDYSINKEYIYHLIATHAIGGVIFLGQSDASEQYSITQELQAISNIPLFVAQDLEWGLAQRIHNTLRYPYNGLLSKITDDTLIERMGYDVGKQCALIGVNWNLAPVADCCTNPYNTVIGKRSFGNDPINVALKASSYAQGLTKAGILSCAKHFPGHGDTHQDSHIELPVLHHSKERLESIELYPFKYLIKNTIPAIMIGHLAVPTLDTSSAPASLSPKIVTELLIETLGFDGLIITDALDMKAITNHYTPGQAAVLALKAGCDILLCCPDIPAAIEAIEKALEHNILTQEDIDLRVEKILHAKTWLTHHNNINALPYDAYDLINKLNEKSFIDFKIFLDTVVQEPHTDS